jgi:hypothetical protein
MDRVVMFVAGLGLQQRRILPPVAAEGSRVAPGASEHGAAAVESAPLKVVVMDGRVCAKDRGKPRVPGETRVKETTEGTKGIIKHDTMSRMLSVMEMPNARSQNHQGFSREADERR